MNLLLPTTASALILISAWAATPRELHMTRAAVGTEATAYVQQLQGPLPSQEGASSVADVVAGILRREGISVAEASKLIACESSWNPNAVNTRNKNGSVDKGLWQINSIHGLSDEEMFDPVQSTEFAVKLYRKYGWEPWVCSRKV